MTTEIPESLAIVTALGMEPMHPETGCMAPTEQCICYTPRHIELNRQRLMAPCNASLTSNYRVPHFTSPMERFVVQCRMRVDHDGPHTYHAPVKNVIRWTDDGTVVEASGVYLKDDWPAIGDRPQPVDFPPGEVAADLHALLHSFDA